MLLELGRLGARGEAVISTNIEVRLDGLPRSDRRAPEDPGAAVYWNDAFGKPRVMAIDLYTKVADNLAAIAATLEAMRAIERHGGAQILERAFTGFDALPAPRRAHEILGVSARASRDEINAAYRRLAKELHPDGGGNAEAFKELNAARDEALRGAPNA